MAERAPPDAEIARADHRALVSLRVVAAAAEPARERLGLAAPGRIGASDPCSLWIGPGHWLLAEDETPPPVLIERCAEGLAGIVHLALDESAAWATWRVSGPGARGLLARGTGLDLRPARFAAGACTRTRLAGIAAIVVARGEDRFEVLVERSHAAYFGAWLTDSIGEAESG